ncbi:hypothetical protein Droror1_Dr00002213 [Drosera rotundifolia]
MANPTETSTPSEPLDTLTLRSRIAALSSILKHAVIPLEASASSPEMVLRDCVKNLQEKVWEVVSDGGKFACFVGETLDVYEEGLREMLREVEAENEATSKEIEGLKESYMEGTCALERKLEGLNCMLIFAESQGFKGPKESRFLGYSASSNHADHSNVQKLYSTHSLESLTLNHQLENKEMTLKSLEDLEYAFRRLKAVEKIEDIFSGMKVIEFEGQTIRLSLTTCIPEIQCSAGHHPVLVDSKSSEVIHELLIEIKEETLELKNAVIFPDDVYVADVIEASSSFRKVSSWNLDKRFLLDWFLQKVQGRILISNVRRLMVDAVNKSRHTLDYLDIDELIIAHILGGIDAFIKPTEGWPLSDSPLKLVTLKSSGPSKEISLALLCKVEEVANSLDCNLRKDLVDFVDAIEKILIQESQTRTPL